MSKRQLTLRIIVISALALTAGLFLENILSAFMAPVPPGL